MRCEDIHPGKWVRNARYHPFRCKRFCHNKSSLIAGAVAFPAAVFFPQSFTETAQTLAHPYVNWGAEGLT